MFNVQFMKLKKDRAVRFLFSFVLASFFFWGCIALEVDGVDWQRYATIRPNFEIFYYYREFFSWWVITTISHESNSFYNALIGGLIYFLLVHSSLSVANSLLNRIGKSEKGYIPYMILPFLTTNFYVLQSVNGLRQGISSAFLLYAFSLLISRNRFSSFCFFLIAVFSHNAALFYFPIFIVFLLPIKKLYKLGPLISFLILFLGSLILQVAGKSSGESSSNNTLAFAFFMLVIYVFCYFVFKGSYNSGCRDERLSKGLVTSFAFYTSFAVFSVITDEMSFERLVYYSFLIIIPFLVVSFSRFKGASYVFVLFVLISPIVLLLFFNTNAYQAQFILLRP